ncbi:hypothetical protein JMJ35_001478 [Cladonia borealis]|uniref:Fungal N-terminal domain-containing protein n=1 Tax=Cladonia borealis TaxID=184061 RepID=A0AA39V715_9LECA|nr:hypothetical protein JMJ35_001478 [Cladonia borealis]
MADPFSSIGSFLGILSSLLTISQAVIEIVDDVRNASHEIRCLSRDIHAFFSLIRSLDISLREQDVRDIVASDEAILYQIHSLEESLRNCRDVLTKLMVKHEEFKKKGDCMGFRKLRWAIFTKGEVRSLQLPLEIMKSTLNGALNAVTMFVSIRVLAMIRSSATSATRNSGEQILDSISSLVYQTHLSIVSDDRELCQQVARIYRRLGERRELVQQLRTTIARTPQSSYDSSTVEVFLDFVSRFSVNGPNSSIDRLLGDMSGHPNYLLETSPSFHPEQYDTAFPDRMMSISAILPLPSHPQTQRYYVTFQEKTRKWQRVIIVATFENFRDPSALIQVSAIANLRLASRIIPERLQTPLQRLVREIENFGSVTNVFVNLRENENGQIAADMTRVRKAENILERHMSNENTILQEIEHLGCPQFVESQVIFKSQLICYRYKVWIGDRDFTECKVPFASAGLQGDNLFDEFADEVKRLTSLRGCSGIVQFLGVILDDRYLAAPL